MNSNQTKAQDGTVQVQGKECIFCRCPINGAAIPVQETSSIGGKVSQVRTRYAHKQCAEEMAEE